MSFWALLVNTSSLLLSQATSPPCMISCLELLRILVLRISFSCGNVLRYVSGSVRDGYIGEPCQGIDNSNEKPGSPGKPGFSETLFDADSMSDGLPSNAEPPRGQFFVACMSTAVPNFFFLFWDAGLSIEPCAKHPIFINFVCFLQV
jgi:hypothetical protein